MRLDFCPQADREPQAHPDETEAGAQGTEVTEPLAKVPRSKSPEKQRGAGSEGKLHEEAPR